jgi:hypothetical protein
MSVFRANRKILIAPESRKGFASPNISVASAQFPWRTLSSQITAGNAHVNEPGNTVLHILGDFNHPTRSHWQSRYIISRWVGYRDLATFPFDRRGGDVILVFWNQRGRQGLVRRRGWERACQKTFCTRVLVGHKVCLSQPKRVIWVIYLRNPT